MNAKQRRRAKANARRKEMMETMSDEQLLEIANNGTGIEREAARGALVKRHVPSIGAAEAELNNQWYAAKTRRRSPYQSYETHTAKAEAEMAAISAKHDAMAERGETARSQSEHPHVPYRMGKK